MKKYLLIIAAFFIGIIGVNAEERTGYINNIKITIDNSITNKLSDNNYNTNISITQNQTIKITSEEEFKHIYIVYYLNSKTGTISYNKKENKIGVNSFLHEYIKLDEKTNEVNIKYDEDVRIKEIFAFKDEIPSWVQDWQPPHEDADIMLISTHSDDEQLFFAGLIPSMVAQGKKMQVVYFTNHNNNPSRLDEQLNGLWAVGLRNYPVFGFIPDAYSESLNGAISNMKSSGYSIDDAIKFEVDMIRRFKPEVVVDHDENGEYGHGQHRLNTYALKEALKVVNNENYSSDYKPFGPYKVYLHLYKENKIKMDFDTPLDYFNGASAFQMSQLGYKEHLSQQYTWFTRWINGNKNQITKASEITTYSPLEYGLYYSTVGYENEDNNMFYNIPEEQIQNKIYNAKVINYTNDSHRSNSFKIFMISLSLSIFIMILLIILVMVNDNNYSRRKRRRRRFRR